MIPPPPRVALFAPGLALLLWGLVAGGCGGDGHAATSGNATTPAPLPTGGAGATGTTEATAGMTSGGPVACQVSAPACFCAGEHVTGQTAPPTEGLCRVACVPDGFISLWCLDDAACCSGTCQVSTGFCVGGGTTSTSGATVTSGASDTGTSTSTGG